MGREIEKLELLTVVVPISEMAGRLKNLSKWLNSELNPQITVVLVHDIGDTKTGEELREIISRAESVRIHLLEGEFGSPGSARNAGTFYVKTQWVAFWDSDDIPNPKEILKELSTLESDPEVLIGNFRVQRGNSHFEVSHNSRVEKIGLNPGLWRMVFASRAIEGISFPNFKMGEDQIFLARFGLGHRRILYSNAIFYTYFKGIPNQLTSRKDLTNREAILEMGQLISKKSSEIDTFTHIAYGRLLASALLMKPGSISKLSLLWNFGLLIKLPLKTNLNLAYFAVSHVRSKSEI